MVGLGTLPILSRLAGADPMYLHAPLRYPPFNPGVVAVGDDLVFVARSSNLQTIDERAYVPAALPHETRNHLFVVSRTWQLLSDGPVDDRLIRATPHAAGGFEDCRLFQWRGRVWGLAAGVGCDARGYIGQVTQLLIRFDGSRIDAALPLPSPRGSLWEKNWTPVVRGDRLFVIYDLAGLVVFEVVDGALRLVRGDPAASTSFPLSGGTPLIPWGDRLIGLGHVRHVVEGRWVYTHAWVIADPDLRHIAFSRPFILHRTGIEFACGLALHDGGPVVAFGEADCRSGFFKVPGPVVDALIRIDG